MLLGKMSRKFLALVMTFSLSLLTGCFWGDNGNQGTPGMYLVNVLEPSFFDDCHIPGSLNIAMMDVKIQAASWPKTADVVIYCSNYSCEASTYCCKQLQKMGFEHVWDYEEGMAGWYQAHLKNPNEYPINGPSKQEYLMMENKPLSDDAHSSQVKGISTQELKVLIESHKQENEK